MRRTIYAVLIAAAVVSISTSVRPKDSKPPLKPLPAVTQFVTPVVTATGHTPNARVEIAPAAATPSCPPAAPIAGSSVRTFGFVNPVTGLAVENAVWTFDHAGGSMEGWTRDDLTEDDFAAFRHVTAAGWSGHSNVPSPPIMNGPGSMWLGFHEDEADSACWDGGLGYGDNWDQQFISPTFNNTIGDSVIISFDYWYDSEPGYDKTEVYLDTGGLAVPLMTVSGQGGTYGTPLHFSQKVAVTGSFQIVFHFTSDGVFSDVDDGYSTTLGAFGFDDLDVVGYESTSGPPTPHAFDTGLDGWTAQPTPGAGAFADVYDFSIYSVGGCGQSGNVLAFHNPFGEHPAGQRERVTSPPVDISSYGTAPLNIWAEYDIYADTPLPDSVFWTWEFQYYPAVCPVTGDSTWSDPAGPNLIFYHPSTQCTTYRSFANDATAPGVGGSGTTLVPAGADSVRFLLSVFEYATVDIGNTWPVFDNITIGVSNAANVLHVPSPAYPTIQQGLTAAIAGDSVVVAPGTYTGALNRDLDFDGNDIVLLSEAGPIATTIDCERVGRGFYFHSGESAAAVVDGFRVIHGTTQAVGAGIYILGGSSPTIRNCRFSLTTILGSAYGIVRIDSGSPNFSCCVVSADTSMASGGALRVNGGSPDFNSCSIVSNVMQFSTVSLIGGTPSMSDCDIANNTSTHAAIITTPSVMDACYVISNSGNGVYIYPSGASMFYGCTFAENGTGGVGMEDNSSSFFECVFEANSGPGLTITNVSFRDADAPGPSPSAAVTSPYFENCRFTGNVNTSSSGGGILFDCANIPTTTFQPSYVNCLITGNSSLFNGGGIAVCGQSVLADIAPYFESCTVAANNAGQNGGGLYVATDNGGSEIYAGVVTMQRTIMWGNCADSDGAQAFMETGNYLWFECSNFDSLGIDGTGNLLYDPEQVFDDPEFCDPAECNANGTLAGAFTLFNGSPADSLNSPCGLLIGANPTACSPMSGAGDGRDVPATTALSQNVPNPFNPTTRIRFDLARTGHVSLRVYDVAGRLVRTLVDGTLPAAHHTRTWDGLDNHGTRVASGVYFVRLVSGDVTETRKMVMLK